MRARWLPPEFDPGFYRKCKPYLADARDNVLEQEFRKYGLASGTPGSYFCYRKNIIKYLDSVAGSILEIGPGGHPDFLGARVKYLDVFTTGEMEEKYGGEGKPPRIDYSLDDLVRGIIPQRFDVVYSAHNFEHQINPVHHIASVAKILAPNGLFVAVIPDRNFTFDYFRTPTTLTDILSAPASQTRHTAKSRLERFNRTHNNSFAHWFGNHGMPEDRDEAIIADFAAGEAETFLSLHVGVYDPQSFRKIFGLLSAKGLLGLELLRVYNTPFLRNEFVTVFRKSDSTEGAVEQGTKRNDDA